ncbi:MAG: adenylate/guanylate cyclase domain-containing protein [Proteobacteria bacterium]|nr:adenylate/guanylate cyclase domain-containing protein [Pseudomonadota bacterium]
MNEIQFADLVAWTTEAGLKGEAETELVTGFCERMMALGLPLARVSFVIDTLHPVYEGRAVLWRRGGNETKLIEYGRTETGEASESWKRSPFFYLLDSGEKFMRQRLAGKSEREFAIFPELREMGLTDYTAFVSSFGVDDAPRIMDGICSSWCTDSKPGFRDADIADLRRTVPLVAMALKSASLTHIAETLVNTYLGRDAGRRVLRGHIARGVADRIETVLWFSDLRGFTRITDSAAPDQIIPLLNDYAEAIIAAIHDQGGDVLKLMGDGVLAIFTGDDRSRACRQALAAAGAAAGNIEALSQRRLAAELPTTEMYLGLHVGEVFYGNVGSKDRLDFTVVGPAVNEVSRIAALCRSVDRTVLLSSAFAAALGGADSRLVSVGRYALRGVSRPQDLFTLHFRA